MEWRSWGLTNINDEYLKNPELERQYRDKYIKFKKARSEIIEAALEVENAITAVLLHFLVGQDYSRHKLLRAFIFDAEFCSFMQKRKMLSTLFDMFPSEFNFFSPEENKRLRRDINNIVLERNIFAHGNMFVDVSDGDIIIEYYYERKQRVKIDEERIHATLKNCEIILNMLIKLNDFLRDNRLELTE